jgi:hypothetical protein
VVRYRESGGVLIDEDVLLEGPELGPNNHQGGSVRFAPDKTLSLRWATTRTLPSPRHAT